jgi:hypothetical protein
MNYSSAQGDVSEVKRIIRVIKDLFRVTNPLFYKITFNHGKDSDKEENNKVALFLLVKCLYPYFSPRIFIRKIWNVLYLFGLNCKRTTNL